MASAYSIPIRLTNSTNLFSDRNGSHRGSTFRTPSAHPSPQDPFRDNPAPLSRPTRDTPRRCCKAERMFHSLDVARDDKGVRPAIAGSQRDCGVECIGKAVLKQPGYFRISDCALYFNYLCLYRMTTKPPLRRRWTHAGKIALGRSGESRGSSRRQRSANGCGDKASQNRATLIHFLVFDPFITSVFIVRKEWFFRRPVQHSLR